MSSSPTTATFAVELQNRMSGPAGQAAGSLNALKSKIETDTKALREMEGAMRRLKGGTSTNVAAFKDLRDKITAQKASIADAQSKFVQLGGTFGDTAPKAQGLVGMLESLFGQAGKMPGPLGEFAGKLGGIQGLLAGGIIVGGIMAIVAGMVALTAAAIGTAAALLKYGIAQSDARRSELLRLEGLTKLRSYWTRQVGNAQEMQSAIDEVSDSTTLGRGEIERYSASLYRSGLRGQNLTSALQAVATAGSAMGDSMASRVAGMAAGFNMTGQSVQKLADRIKNRFGALADAQFNSLGNLSDKLHERIARIFSGLHLEGFLSGLRSIVDLFSQNEASGRALKAMFERLFQPLLDGATDGMPVIRTMIEYMILGLLRIERVILTVRIAFKKLFGHATFGEGFARVGQLLVTGLAAGIKSAWGLLKSTVDALGYNAINTITEVLGIHSPSRVFAQLGVQVPRGFAEGIERGSGDVGGAVDHMVRMGDYGAEGQGATGTPGQTITVSIGDIHVSTQADNPRAHAESIRDELARILEGVRIQIGAPA